MTDEQLKGMQDTINLWQEDDGPVLDYALKAAAVALCEIAIRLKGIDYSIDALEKALPSEWRE